MKIKNTAVWLLVVVVLSAVCTGCGGTPETGDAGNTEVMEQSASSGMEEASSNMAVQQEAQSGAVTTYAPALDEICGAIYNGLNEDWEYDYLPTGILERIMYDEQNYLLANLGWTVRDISGDNVPELLVGALPDESDGTSAGGVVYGGYTLRDGQIVQFLDSWGRNSYQWMGGGRFFNSGSAGAAASAFGTCHISPDGTELLWEDFYFTDWKIPPYEGGEENPENIGLFHNTTGEWETAQSEELSITGEAFWSMSEDLANQFQQLELTPLSQYPYTGDAAE